MHIQLHICNVSAFKEQSIFRFGCILWRIYIYIVYIDILPCTLTIFDMLLISRGTHKLSSTSLSLFFPSCNNSNNNSMVKKNSDTLCWFTNFISVGRFCYCYALFSYFHIILQNEKKKIVFVGGSLKVVRTLLQLPSSWTFETI